MKRVVLFKNGTDVDGKVCRFNPYPQHSFLTVIYVQKCCDVTIQIIMITHSFEELISAASKKCGILVKRIFTAEGGEIDGIELIRYSFPRIFFHSIEYTLFL